MTSDACCDNALGEMPELTKIGKQFLSLWTHHQLYLKDSSVWSETLRRDSSKGSKATTWLSQDEHMARWAVPRVSEGGHLRLGHFGCSHAGLVGLSSSNPPSSHQVSGSLAPAHLRLGSFCSPPWSHESSRPLLGLSCRSAHLACSHKHCAESASRYEH